MTQNKGMNRRNFLKLTSTAVAATSMGAYSLAAREPRPINQSEKLNIACVGIGGKGKADVAGVSGENIVALCDVDWEHGAASIKKHPQAAKYKDYRKMLDEMDEQIDAVTVTTPDHSHFPIAMAAIARGKHVYVQKPLTHSVWEARELRLTARRHGVATQMGNQGHANEGTRLVREWVQSGMIGDVREVHIWTDRPGHRWAQGIERPTDTPPVPKGLDWNIWLGTAPVRPYHPAYLPKVWRGWWDFGCGALGDMGCHIMDASYWALDLGSPISIESQNSPLMKETAPSWSIVTYEFPARGAMPPVTLKWYDGGKQPPRPKELEANRKLDTNGQLIVGEKATIMAGTYCESPRIIPETKMRALMSSRPPKTIPRIDQGDPYREWIRACKGGPIAGSNFEYSGPLTEMVLLGNLAIQTGEKVFWDPVKMMTNVPKANRLIHPPPRKF